MEKRILLGSIIAVAILLGVTFSSVVGVQDDESTSEKAIIASNAIHSVDIGEYRGFVFIVAISDYISSNDSIVDIIVGIVGAIIGNLLLGSLFGAGLIGTIITALIGAIILLLIIKLIKKA